MTTPPTATGGARIDAWMWSVRLFKTRSLATAACRAGHVRLNGDKAKAATLVKPDDEIRVRTPGGDRIVVVKRPVAKRVGALVAAKCMTDLTPPPPPKAEIPLSPQRDRGAGRPTKRDRRQLERLRGRHDESDY